MGAVTTPPASSEKVKLPLVSDFFKGKDVFVTGASGFLGRALIWKLLKSCPDLGTIYLLLRPKRGKSGKERMAVFTDDPAFEYLQKEQPEILGKLKIVIGDMESLELGLSAEDQKMLKERVSVVFHVAATVRFDEVYRKAVLLNVRGTREVCELASVMPLLEAFVHVSTAYSNTDVMENEEKLYPSAGDWRTHITLAENENETNTMQTLLQRLLGGFPNSYVFTKNLAESVINDYKYKIPAAIIRPSVVINGVQEPVPGWADNLLGAWGVSVGTTAGVVHAMINTTGLDVVPVDFWAKGAILLTVKRSVWRKKEEVLVCNASSHDFPAFRIDLMLEHFYLYPLYDMFRPYKPFIIKIPIFLIFTILFIFVSIPPAFVLDMISSFSKKRKRKLVKLHRTIYSGVSKILYFSKNKFHLPNHKFMALREEMNPGDKEQFYWSFEEVMDSPYIVLGFTFFFKNILNKKRILFPWQDTILELLHTVICCCLFYLCWKLNIIQHIFLIVVRSTRLLLSA